MHVLQDEVDIEREASDGQRLAEVIPDKAAAGGPVAEVHKGLEVTRGGRGRERGEAAGVKLKSTVAAV